MSTYTIKSIEKVNAPQGVTFKRWYKFIIANDKNTIVNLRSGSEKEVRNFAMKLVQRLNEKYLTHIKFKAHKPVNDICLSNNL